MSKKIVLFMSIICIGLAAVVFYMRLQTDRKGPEIVVDQSAAAVYKADMTDAELLEGVTATDKKDGDVSSSLTVESVYDLNATEVVITYAAKDSENNITKLKRTMEAEAGALENLGDMSAEKKEEQQGTDTDGEQENPDVQESEETENSLEGSDENGEEDESSLTPTPSEKSDEEKAEELKEEQEKLADEMPATSPQIYLSEYYVKLPVGASWDPVSYVSKISDDADDMYALWRKIQVEDEVKTTVPGTYTCTYYVVDSQNNVSNNAVLTVVVGQ